MLVIGIDPGTRYLGWGLVRRDGTRLVHVGHGVIATDAQQTLGVRLVQIDQELCRIIAEFGPQAGAVESLFFAKDAQAAAKLGHARGVVLLALARAGLPIGEYPPARVKQVVAGSGRADKRQVALMMRALLGLKELPRADATDALALAVTHLRLGPLAGTSLTMARGRAASRLPGLAGRRGKR